VDRGQVGQWQPLSHLDRQFSGVDASDQVGELVASLRTNTCTVRTPRPASCGPGVVTLTKAPPAATRSASCAFSSAPTGASCSTRSNRCPASAAPTGVVV
jgi:hypothetical protein